MFLNINFNKTIESTILLNKPLADWFTKNQETMAYFELTSAGCLHFENNTMASNDVRVLGRMANASLTWLEGNHPLTKQEIALKAAEAIAQIYKNEKDSLSETAQELYYIDLDILKIPAKQKVLIKHNGIKNRRPGQGHRNH